MIKNGNYFVAPQKTSDNFKVLFARLAAQGAGRPVDRHGIADGPWTPETLAEAISSLEGNDKGIELRAVQVWFQDNDNGISNDNIRWLARIFGCNDPEATSQWQAELRASKDRLTKERRQKRRTGKPVPAPSTESSPPTVVSGDQERRTRPELVAEDRNGSKRSDATAVYPAPVERRPRFNIARQTEAMFGSESSLTLPLVVFTGACALALIAYTLNIHSIIYTPLDGAPRQVGFLWAPNWTIVFIAILPVFLSILIQLMQSWSEDWRPTLLSIAGENAAIRTWDRGLSKATYSFWVTFIVTVLVASVYNWTATHLIPLLDGDPGGWPVDWGRIATVQPGLVSIPAAIAFTGIVFLYNGFTSYLFFAGHIFLHLMKSDFINVTRAIDPQKSPHSAEHVQYVGENLMNGVFRCTALGIVITLMMKLQSGFLHYGSSNILDWLLGDILSVVGWDPVVDNQDKPRIAAPGHIYSFLCVLAIAGTFVSAQLSIRTSLRRLNLSRAGRWASPWTSMNICMTLLVTSYFAIGFLPGFTVLVLLSLLVTGYLVTKPVEREAVVVA